MAKNKYNPYRAPPIRPIQPPQGYKREIVSRAVWGAAPALHHPPMAATSLPVENVIFTYKTDTQPCEDEEACQRTLRQMQQAHLARGLPDLAYNFVIGGDLKIYEGRGWDLKPEKNAKFPELHNDSIEIAFIGDYTKTELNEKIMSELIKEGLHTIDIGVRLKNVTEFFRIKEATPKLRIETMGEDERKWVRVKKTELTLDDPPTERNFGDI